MYTRESRSICIQETGYSRPLRSTPWKDVLLPGTLYAEACNMFLATTSILSVPWYPVDNGEHVGIVVHLCVRKGCIWGTASYSKWFRCFHKIAFSLLSTFNQESVGFFYLVLLLSRQVTVATKIFFLWLVATNSALPYSVQDAWEYWLPWKPYSKP